MNEGDLRHLNRCIELATLAVDAGDAPFGSVLVSGEGKVLFEERNRIGQGNAMLHPEFAIAQWAVAHLTPHERQASSVYTSGEHCVMCAAAHGLAGLGRIVFATSSAQLGEWLCEQGQAPPRITPLPITAIIPNAVVEGPVQEYHERVRALHARASRRRKEHKE